MTNKTRTILFIFIGLGILAMIAYGYFSSKKLEEQKITKVESNIDDYLYDESKEELDVAETDEDLDGTEVVDEDDDFEVYEEDDDEWDDAELPVTKSKDTEEEDLEELYDPAKEQKKETTPAKEIKSNPAKEELKLPEPEGKYLVIIGSFKSKTNANKKLKTLEKTGRKGTILQLKDSKLQTVVAGRFTNESNAEKLAEQLTEEHEIRAFVKEIN